MNQKRFPDEKLIKEHISYKTEVELRFLFSERCCILQGGLAILPDCLDAHFFSWLIQIMFELSKLYK